jgi:peptide/nickel transport system substrate-binding protein
VNQTYVDDPEIGEVLRDKRFRKAISHAMNRRRIVEVVFEGVGEPKQGTISEQAWHFQSEEGRAVLRSWERTDAAYDPGRARRLLDSAGLVDRDGDGWRELPSGGKFTLIMDLGEWGGKEICTEATEAYRGDLEAVGIRVAVNNLIQQPGWDLRQREGQYMLRNAITCELDIWTYPDWIFPVRDNRSWPMYGRWRQTGGAEGWAPPEGSAAARLTALYDRGLNEPDEGMRHRIVWEAIQIHIEDGPFFIGAAGDQTQPVVVAKNFRNVPETGILGPWAPGSPGNKHPEQFWIEQHE